MTVPVCPTFKAYVLDGGNTTGQWDSGRYSESRVWCGPYIKPCVHGRTMAQAGCVARARVRVCVRVCACVCVCVRARVTWWWCGLAVLCM